MFEQDGGSSSRALISRRGLLAGLALSPAARLGTAPAQSVGPNPTRKLAGRTYALALSLLTACERS